MPKYIHWDASPRWQGLRTWACGWARWTAAFVRGCEGASEEHETRMSAEGAPPGIESCADMSSMFAARSSMCQACCDGLMNADQGPAKSSSSADLQGPPWSQSTADESNQDPVCEDDLSVVEQTVRQGRWSSGLHVGPGVLPNTTQSHSCERVTKVASV